MEGDFDGLGVDEVVSKISPERRRVMIYRKLALLATLLWLSLVCLHLQAATSWIDSHEHEGDFPLVSKEKVPRILVASDDFTVVQIAAKDLASDIKRVTGQQPDVKSFGEVASVDLSSPVVIVGTLGKNQLIDRLVSSGKLDVTDLQGEWESFIITTVKAPKDGIPHALVIVGSDRRGTAFGVYEVSKEMGVSPWYWWSDVATEKKSSLFVSSGPRRFGSPSVKYRGIFINDEGWGLHQWAAKTFEPENGGIGPETYRKVFELMLRLKANTIWPAMHPVTTPFNNFPQNAQLADDFAIVMASSHAEPMLRNNVGEWVDRHDHYNYLTHRDKVLGYWEERVRTNGKFENIYTMGMRGIHDSHIQGPTTDSERIKLLEKVFSDQRALISKHTGRPLGQVPQMFCVYKEVLSLYRQELNVPDDVTIVWPDDNFGYVRDFAKPEERNRSGGFGVYYHISYLGAPMAYLWLYTTPPALVWEEMSKSYEMGADRIWIANVGDIKPAEIGTELFLQMAWDINRWERHNISDFVRDWAAREFGDRHAESIAGLMQDYYRLNYQRKPEHLQWWLPLNEPELSPLTPEEADQRQNAFLQLIERAEKIGKGISKENQYAFFQLVGYPVKGSALANIRFLEGERGNRVAAQAADAQLQKVTSLWDTWLSGGKWEHFMAVEPSSEEWNQYRLAPWVIPKETKAKRASHGAQRERQSFAFEAEDFSRKINQPGVAWEIIPQLGRTGEGSMGVFPVSAPTLAMNQWKKKAPWLEYDLNFPKAGEFSVHVYLIPTHPLSGTQLRFALALNDEAPQLVALEVDDGGKGWAQGVLNASRVVKTKVSVAKAGKHKLKVYGVDAGVLLDKLVVDIDGLPESYLGLPSGSIKK
jgi:hypothetical protein